MTFASVIDNHKRCSKLQHHSLTNYLLVRQDDESGLPFWKFISEFVDVDVFVFVAVGDDDFSNGVDFQDECPVVLASVEPERLQSLTQA